MRADHADLRNVAGLERRRRKGARDYAQLPAEAQHYIKRLEEVSGVPVGIVSTGSDRDETIIRDGQRRRDVVELT